MKIILNNERELEHKKACLGNNLLFEASPRSKRTHTPSRSSNEKSDATATVTVNTPQPNKTQANVDKLSRLHEIDVINLIDIAKTYPDKDAEVLAELKKSLRSGNVFANDTLVDDLGIWQTIYLCMKENNKPLENEFIKTVRKLMFVPPNPDNFLLFYDMWKKGEIGPEINNKNSYLNNTSFWERPSDEFLFTAKIFDALTDKEKASKYFEKGTDLDTVFDLLFTKGNTIRSAGINDLKFNKDGYGENIYSVIDYWQKKSGTKEDKKSNAVKKLYSQKDILDVGKAISTGSLLTTKQLNMLIKILQSYVEDED